jgi:pentatricopeptide repeat protein
VDALLKQGHQPQDLQQLEWAHGYYMAGRLEAARNMLLSPAQEDPRRDAIRVAYLAKVHLMLGEWNCIPTAIAQRPALSSVDVEWLRSLEVASRFDFTMKLIAQAVNGQHSFALATLQTAHSRGLESLEYVWELVAMACCVDDKTDVMLEVLSMMSAESLPLTGYYADEMAAACAAHDESTLRRVLITLNSAKQNSCSQVTQQLCTLAVAAACKLANVDSALTWFDVMHQQSIYPDAGTYGSVATVCLKNGKYQDSLRVLAVAKAAGLMPETADGNSSATKWLRSIGLCAESGIEISQSTVRS